MSRGRCATHEQLGRGDATHACLACRLAREEQQAITDVLAKAPVPTLSASRRAALAAEVMARADLQGEPKPATRRKLAIAIATAMLAAAGVMLVMRDPATPATRRVVSPPIAEVAIEQASPPPALASEPPRVARAQVVAEPPAVVEHVAPPPAPPRKRIDGARQVFGATSDNQRASIDRETIEVEHTAVTAFRAGWEALRAARYAEAIAAFDRATDPAVAEDAAFWSAIAAQRGGDLDEARKRLDSFLRRFPTSPRADDARRAREVLR